MPKCSDVNDVTILLAEDDDGHATLIVENLKEAGVHNQVVRFHDGQEVLDFFFGAAGTATGYQPDHAYLLLLDIRMPRVDGIEVLERMKKDPVLRKMPIIMVTTTDDPREIGRCHDLGCSVYVVKPVGFQAFTDALRSLGLFILVIQVPGMETIANGSHPDTILIVEDDEGVAELIRALLQDQGLETAIASTGGEALAWMASRRPSLLILDYSLPDMKGTEFIGRAAEMPPFIVATGMGDERIAVEMMKRGARDYIVKDGRFIDILPVVVKRVLDQLATERQLAQSEHRLHRVFEESHAGMFLAGLDGRLLRVNPMLCRMTGRSPEELTGRSLLEITHPDDVPGEAAKLEALREGRAENYQSEQRFVAREGHATWVLLSVAVVRDVGYAPQLIGQAQDITQRKQAEESLAREREQLRTILDAIPDGVYIVDNDCTIRYTNPVIEREFGPVGSRKCHEYFHDLPEPCSWCKNESVFAGQSIQWEWTSARSGKTYELFDAPIAGPDGSVLKLELFHDITRRIRAEESLRRSETRFENVARHAREMIWEVDPRGLYTYVSRAAEDILGYRPEEIIGRLHFYDLHPEDRREAFKAAAMAVFAEKGRFRDLLNPAVSKSGRIVWLSTSGTPILSPGGELLGYRGADSDITDRRQAEEEKRRLEEQLRQAQKLDALGQLAAGVAHDFNNMLTVIRSQAELGLIVAPGHPATRHLDAVIDTVTQAAEITKSLLTFSRLMPTEKRRLRLAELVADAQKLLRHVLPARIELRSQVDPECRSDILADRTQLYQVLLNLAINARDAMPQGGTLELGLAGGVIPEGGPSPLPAGTRCVRLWIADSGTGIDPAILPRVFEPFFTTKSREEGTGLGLSLVHGIVAQHGGHIEVDSRVGRGTRFTITFPALIAEPAPAGQAGRACGEGESILLAGADTFQTGTIGGYLQSIGYRVFLADGENQVLSILEQHPGQVRLVVLQSDLGPRGALACLARCREKAGPLQAILLPGEGEVRQEQAGDDTLVLEGPITIAEIARMVQKTLTPAGADTP